MNLFSKWSSSGFLSIFVIQATISYIIAWADKEVDTIAGIVSISESYYLQQKIFHYEFGNKPGFWGRFFDYCWSFLKKNDDRILSSVLMDGLKIPPYLTPLWSWKKGPMHLGVKMQFFIFILYPDNCFFLNLLMCFCGNSDS